MAINKVLIFSVLVFNTMVFAQDNGLVANTNSPYTKLKSVNLEAVQWTGGFWKETI